MRSVTGFGPSLESPVLRNTFLRLGNGALNRASGGELIKAANLLVRNCTVAEATAAQYWRRPMVNPLDIMPVLALVFAIMCIPVLGDRP